jgi:selenocysteine lyase/cysteine desulfurase
VERDGVAESGRRQYELARRLAQALAGVDRIRVHGPWRGLPPAPDAAETWSPPTAPIISLAVEGLASAEVARVLDKEFQIAVRAGLHCAPQAHRMAGTLQEGLVRLSRGHTTTEADVAEAAGALIEIADRPAHYWLTEWEGHNAQ